MNTQTAFLFWLWQGMQFITKFTIKQIMKNFKVFQTEVLTRECLLVYKTQTRHIDFPQARRLHTVMYSRQWRVDYVPAMNFLLIFPSQSSVTTVLLSTEMPLAISRLQYRLSSLNINSILVHSLLSLNIWFEWHKAWSRLIQAHLNKTDGVNWSDTQTLLAR